MTSTACETRTTTRPPALAAARRPSTTRPTPAPAPVVRLTQRGRVAVVATVLLAAGGAFTLRGAPAASTDVVHHAKTSTFVVSPGDTLWDIAESVTPHGDLRATVAQIEDLNSLSDPAAIRVGQPLLVPRG